MTRYMLFTTVVLIFQVLCIPICNMFDRTDFLMITNLSCLVIIVLGALSNVIPKCRNWWIKKI